MTDAGPQDQIDDNENDQESVSLPGVLHGKPAMGEGGGGGAPTKLFNMWSFVLLFVLYYDGHSVSCQVIFTSVKRRWG